MSDPFTRVVSTREGAHQAICDSYAAAKLLIEDGRRVRISVGEDEDSMTLRQRKFLHGPVLTQMSEQARDEGKRYLPKVWKEYFRGLFLGSTFETINGRTVEVRISTEGQSVKDYSDYIDRVIAHAAIDWSVTFLFIERDRDAVRYRPKAAARQHATA